MVLSSPTYSEMVFDLKRLNVKNSNSDDQTPKNLLPFAADVILPYFAYLVGFMFFDGIFPNALKIAKVIPINNLVQNRQLKIINQSHCIRLFQKSLKK